MKSLTVILIEPENPGNTGAILRSMKNFDQKDMLLVNPQFNVNSEELKNRAKWANNLVKKIKVMKYDMKKLRKKFDYLIATTAKMGRDYNIPRIPITPEQLAEQLHKIKKREIGLLIGREGSGLTNAEIKFADYVVTIPSSKKYGTMNISHATNILLYELFKKNATETITSHITPIGQKEKEQLLKMVESTLSKMHFTTEGKKETQRTLWKKLIGKSYLSKREAYALMGFLKKIK
jgi:TrmH family RNA methyltransferase